MNVAELYAKYYSDGWQPPERVPLEPVVSDATTQVIPYVQWIKLRCACCQRHGCSGLWQCQFTNGSQPLLMCAACAFYGAFAKWTGFFSRKLVRVDLIATLTYQSRIE